MDALLLNPPIIVPLSTPEQKGPFSDIAENLGLGYIASSLRSKGYQVKVLDYYLAEIEIEVEKIAEQIISISPELLAFSIPSMAAVPKTAKIIAALREAGVSFHITVGGHYVTTAYKKVLFETGADSLIMFEGELTIVELMTRIKSNLGLEDIKGLGSIKNGVLKMNSIRPVINELDQIPFCSRDTLQLVLKRRGYASISTSRGCYGKCIFCSNSNFFNSVVKNCWRGRTAKNVVDELEFLVTEYGVKDFVFVDDSFIGDAEKGDERAEQIAEEIIKRGLKIKFLIMCRPEEVSKGTFELLKSAGLSAVSIGIEAGAQTALNRLRRNTTVHRCREAIWILKSLDIEVFIGLIPFDPDTTLSEFKETVSFMNKIEELNIGLFRKRMMCLRGTKIEEKLISENRLINGKYKISDSKVETLCFIMEQCGKKWGKLINDFMYVVKWNAGLAMEGSEKNTKKLKVKMCEKVLGKKSKKIIDKMICFVESIKNYSDKDVALFIRKMEDEVKELYEELIRIDETDLSPSKSMEAGYEKTT